MVYFKDKVDAVRYVAELLNNLKPSCALTTTISPVKYEGYSVRIVIEESSEDIELQTAKFFSETQVSI